MGTYKDLIVYKKAFSLAMKIFEIGKQFPKEEKFSNRSNKTLIKISMYKYRRRLQEKKVSCTFCFKNFRFGYGKYRNLNLAGFCTCL